LSGWHRTCCITSGLLAGTALISGAGGTTLFGILGLIASVPFLLRLRRRFGTWWAPLIGLTVFAVMFSVSAFVIGPAISGGGDGAPGGANRVPPSTTAVTTAETGGHATAVPDRRWRPP
jgi:hypothetical protein